MKKAMRILVVMAMLAAMTVSVQAQLPTNNLMEKASVYIFDDNTGLAPAYEVTGWSAVNAKEVVILGVVGMLPKDIEVLSVTTCPIGFVVTQKTQGKTGTYRAIILDFNDQKFKEYVAKLVGRSDTKFVVKNEVRAINFYPEITVR